MTANPELVPGEMRLWTDLSPTALRPAPHGRVFDALLDRVVAPGGRTLVAGPHDRDLVVALADRGDLTVVVRSLGDATELQAAAPGARVVCGSLDALAGLDAAAERGFDTVVALDGVERILSNDTEPLDFAQRWELLRGFLAPGGRLVGTVDNPGSLLARADARPLAERRDTGDWEPPAESDPSRPRTVEQAVGLVGGTAYACFPLVTAPQVLVAVDGPAADDVRVRRAIAGAGALLGERPLLFDPTHELLSTGADPARSAPGWVFVTGAAEADGATPEGFEALFEDHPGRPLSRVRLLSGGEARPVGTAEPASERWLRHEPALTAPPGPTLAEELGRFAQVEDLAGLRALVGRYLAWLDSVEDPARVPVATPDNLTVDLEQLDDSYRLAAPVEAPVALGRVMLATAAILLDPRGRRIWPDWMGPVEVARSVAAMGGATLTDAQWEAAYDLEQEIAAEGPPLLNTDVRALHAVIEELREQLTAARGQVFAHERLVKIRDNQLEKRDNRINQLERRATRAEEALEALEDGESGEAGKVRGQRRGGDRAAAGRGTGGARNSPADRSLTRRALSRLTRIARP